ncbi:hypothetical protein, partial [Agrobacterium vitis]|uniref:hypothetical protein n=1 Tax=Agrobacterium vitis TaxID=373 RepID=UPI001AEDD415
AKSIGLMTNDRLENSEENFRKLNFPIHVNSRSAHSSCWEWHYFIAGMIHVRAGLATTQTET